MILTKYLFKQTINNVLIATCVFVGVIWLTQSFKTIKLIINKGANLSDFFILSFYSFPSWLLIAFPLGTFAGCFISYLKLQNDSEIIVMKSTGISPLKLSNPVLIISALISLILFLISHLILPTTYKNFKILQNKIRNDSQNLILKDNVFVDINKNQTIFIGKLSNNNELNEIFIQDRSDPEYIVEYFSKQGFVTFNKNIVLKLVKGTRISTDSKGTSTILNFKSYDIDINQETHKKNKKSRVIEYNEFSFFKLLNKSKTAKENKGKLIAEAHSRNTVFFMPFVYSLIVMVLILNYKYNKIFSIYRKTSAIGLLLIIQSIVLIIKNIVHSNVNFWPLMYLFPILIIIICILFLKTNQNFNKFLSYFKKV